MEDVAHLGGRYGLEKKLARFEKDEHVMRFGLTPTDMMHILGDYNAFDTDSSINAVKVLSRLSTLSEEEIPKLVYDAFVKKLAVNIQRVLSEQRFKNYQEGMPKEVFDYLWNSFEKPEDGFARIDVCTDFPIIGVGGPSHIFMERVAERLHTKAMQPEHARVANAIGTLAGQIVVRKRQEIVYNPFGKVPGYRVFLGDGKYDVETFEEAEEALVKYMTEQVREKAIERGARGELTVTHSIDKKEEVVNFSAFLFGGTVTVTAYGNII